MDDVLIPFSTAFCRRFIPKGSRLPRSEFPLTNGVAVVRQVQADEAQIAFRIISEPQSATADFTTTLDLLHYADEVWWPLGDYLYSTGAGILGRPRDLISVDEWRGWIDESRDLLRLVPKGASTVTSESPSRKDLSDDHAEVTAQTQSIIFYNYIAYAGAIYVRGGIPVYAQWLNGNRRRVVVVSSGVDRSVVEQKRPGFGAPLFERSETQRALQEGRFWTPENELDMRVNLTRAQPSCPLIEVLRHELITPRIAEQIQLDALFREALRLRWMLRFVGTSVPYGATPVPNRLRSFEHSVPNRLLRRSIFRKFKRAIKPRPDTNLTTKLRLDALRALLVTEKRIPKRHASVVEPLIRAFEMLDGRMAAGVLSEEDAAALRDIRS